MFRDILGPVPDPDDDIKEEREPDDSEALVGGCPWDCECDNCLEEAIKELADQIGFDLESEDIENIKIEYNNNKNYGSFGFLLTRYGKLTIAVKRIKSKEIIQIMKGV